MDKKYELFVIQKTNIPILYLSTESEIDYSTHSIIIENKTTFTQREREREGCLVRLLTKRIDCTYCSRRRLEL